MTYKNDKFRNFYLLIILLLTNNTFPLIRCNLQAQIPFHICKILFEYLIIYNDLSNKKEGKIIDEVIGTNIPVFIEKVNKYIPLAY